MTYSSFSSDRPIGGAASGAKNNAPPAAAAGSLSSPSVEDAIRFVQMVKEAFEERHPDKYCLFFRLMNDFRNQRVAVAEVASTAKALFQDNPDLAMGFNAFLPKGHRIQVGLDELAACFTRDMNLDDVEDDDGGH